MAMPETAMDEDGSPVLGQRKIRPPGQFLVVQRVPEPTPVQEATYGQLRLRILGSDS